jgi:putative transposase
VTTHDDNIPVIGDRGDSETPRDPQGTFEPQIVRKHRRRFDGFDDKLVALYARGMSVRDIHPEEIYGVRSAAT